LTILLDGRTVERKIVRINRRDVKIMGMNNSLNTRIPFIFSRITVTDDDTALCDIPNPKELGTVELRVRRAKLGSQVPYKPPEEPVQALGPVHEKTKKAGVHYATFGDSEESASFQTFSTTYLDGLDDPYIIFRFNYRPIEILQAQEIVSLPQASAGPDGAIPTKSRSKKRLPPRAGNHSKNDHRKRPRRDRTNESDAGPSRQASPYSLDEDPHGIDTDSTTMCKDEEDEDHVDMLKAQLKTVHDVMQDLQGRLDRMEAKQRLTQSKVVKKEASPIHWRSSNKNVIDLTDD